MIRTLRLEELPPKVQKKIFEIISGLSSRSVYRYYNESANPRSREFKAFLKNYRITCEQKNSLNEEIKELENKIDDLSKMVKTNKDNNEDIKRSLASLKDVCETKEISSVKEANVFVALFQDYNDNNNPTLKKAMTWFKNTYETKINAAIIQRLKKLPRLIDPNNAPIQDEVNDEEF